ncbi:MAG: type II toxin-antitoxin system VapC family toxin [Candidatus Humimicrobiaceae bacterium]
MRKYVLDSYALIAYLEKDKGYMQVIDLFEETALQGTELLMNIINWGEVYYIILREQGYDKADEFENNFMSFPVKIIYSDLKLIRKACDYKTFNALAFADCIAAATSHIYDAPLITGDKELKQLKREITIEWL